MLMESHFSFISVSFSGDRVDHWNLNLNLNFFDANELSQITKQTIGQSKSTLLYYAKISFISLLFHLARGGAVTPREPLQMTRAETDPKKNSM